MDSLIDWRLVIFVVLLMMIPYLNYERVQRSVKSDAMDRCAEMEDEGACLEAVAENHQDCWNREGRKRNDGNRRGMITRENVRTTEYLDCLDRGPGALSAEARQGRRNAAENRRILNDPAAF